MNWMKITYRAFRCPFVWSFLAVMALILMLLYGCTTTKYVPVVNNHIEYRNRIDSIRDSVYIHDSTFVSVLTKGDTIMKNVIQWKIHYRESNKIINDTLIRLDTIRVPYPIEKKLTKWQQTKIDIGDYAIFYVIAIIIIIAGRFAYKKFL